MPHVQRWVKRLRKLAKDMPPEVWVFCESGNPHVMARRPEGGVYEVEHDNIMKRGRMDPDGVVELVRTSLRWDGGGW